MAEKTLEITECDEAGNVTATYVQSAIQQDDFCRIDMVVRSCPFKRLSHGTNIRSSYLRIPNRPGRECWMCSCPLGTLTP
jgi:hypothetical protein